MQSSWLLNHYRRKSSKDRPPQVNRGSVSRNDWQLFTIRHTCRCLFSVARSIPAGVFCGIPLASRPVGWCWSIHRTARWLWRSPRVARGGNYTDTSQQLQAASLLEPMGGRLSRDDRNGARGRLPQRLRPQFIGRVRGAWRGATIFGVQQLRPILSVTAQLWCVPDGWAQFPLYLKIKCIIQTIYWAKKLHAFFAIDGIYQGTTLFSTRKRLLPYDQAVAPRKSLGRKASKWENARDHLGWWVCLCVLRERDCRTFPEAQHTNCRAPRAELSSRVGEMLGSRR